MLLFSLLRDFVKSILGPLSLFWLFIIVVIAFYWIGKKKIAKWGLGFTLFWFLLISTPFVPKKLLATLENQYPPILSALENGILSTFRDSVVHILILGSGYETDERLSNCSQLNSSGLERLVEGIRLQRQLHNSKLILSGNVGNQPLPQAEVSSLAAQELGMDPINIDTVNEPWNTKSEAAEYFKRFGTFHKLYLVTNAAHMPRALIHFRNDGLNPIPAPTNYNIRINNIPKSYTYYFPSTGNIRCMEIVFLEYIGILWAKLGGN